jgi:hypothetical protein
MPRFILDDLPRIERGFQHAFHFKPEPVDLLLRWDRIENPAPGQKAMQCDQRDPTGLPAAPAGSDDFALRRRLDKALLFGVGHTQSGPDRVLPGGVWVRRLRPHELRYG